MTQSLWLRELLSDDTHEARSLNVLSVVNPHTRDSATTETAEESTLQDSFLGILTLSVFPLVLLLFCLLPFLSAGPSTVSKWGNDVK